MTERSIHEFADKKGTKRRILNAPGALASWEIAAKALPAKKANAIEGALIFVFEEWINGVRLHNDLAVPEGELDKNHKFFAIKRIPIRAYFWYSEIYSDSIIISHYVGKKWRNLRSRDTKRVKANWAKEQVGEMR